MMRLFHAMSRRYFHTLGHLGAQWERRQEKRYGSTGKRRTTRKKPRFTGRDALVRPREDGSSEARGRHRRTRYFRAGVEMVRARKADRGDRQLPGTARWLRYLRTAGDGDG